MSIIRYIKPLAVFYFVLTYAVLCAQGWERTYGGAQSDVVNDLAQTSDNGWLMVGSSTNFGGSDRDVYLIKTDVDGTEQWHRSFGSLLEDIGNAITLQSDGSIIIAGNEGNSVATKGSIWKRNAQGDPIWSFETTQDSITLKDVALGSDNSVIAVGSEGNRAFILKLDENGNELWSNTLVANDIEIGYALEVLSDNSFLISGFTHDNTSSVNAFLAKIDVDGTLLWKEQYGEEITEEQALCMTTSQNGGFYLAGFSDGADTFDKGIWLAEVDTNGVELNSKVITIEANERARSIIQLADGDLLITGEINTFFNEANGLLLKTNSNGDLIWNQSFGGVSSDFLNQVIPFDNHIYLAGTTASFGAGGFDGWLIKADSLGESLTQVVRGNVFSDANFNCLLDADEVGIENWIIEIVGNKVFYTSPDSDGFYETNVEAGDYVINLRTPNPYWQACANGVPISFSQGVDTVQVDFATQSMTDCPYFTVDLSTPFLRRCFPNTYTVNYCNSGTQTALNASLTIEFDSFLEIDSAEVNLTPLGNNQFDFQIGDLDPFECGFFRVFTTVNCDSTTLGQTHCSSARIVPDTICIPPDPNWDGTSLEVNALCNGDSVQINVTNTAPTAMDLASSFIIIEDEVLTRQGPIKLDGNSDTTIIISANGQTVRFEVEQPQGHPGNSRPAIAVEGCGGNPFSIGFVTQFPQDDGDNFVEIDCQENIGAFDPNDKRGFPKGYGTEKLIENDTEIEYIIRFQNTGTDTAFTVVIRDTLKQELDPSTIKLGTSSHPYQFEMYGNGILRFTFDDILLVDSFTNEPASHGFVKFKIKPDASIQNNAVILNSADIYFDFNKPITTNESLHRIGSNFVQVRSATSNLFLPNVSVEIAPNPFTDQTQIILKGIDNGKFQFELFNAFGQSVNRQRFNGTQFSFKKNNLPKGVYFFSIKNEERQWITSGKIVIQ